VRVRARVGRALRLGKRLRQPCRASSHALAQQLSDVSSLGRRLLLRAAQGLEPPAGAAVADDGRGCWCCCRWSSASSWRHDAQAGLGGWGRHGLLLLLLLLLTLAPGGGEPRQRRRRGHPFVALGAWRLVALLVLLLLLRPLLGRLAVAQLDAGEQAGHGVLWGGGRQGDVSRAPLACCCQRRRWWWGCEEDMA
jgi:hypothetical protein